MCSKSFLFFAVLATLACSCSVLEDRGRCPAFLHLVLDDGNAVCDSVFLLVRTPSDILLQQVVHREDYADDIIVQVLDRDTVYVNVMDRSISPMFYGVSSQMLTIPEGYQCPQVYMYASAVAFPRDEVCDSVRVHKNYCGVSMAFSSAAFARYDIVVSGNVQGYDMAGEPSEGLFEYAPFVDDPSVCYFRLPRQIDDSLVLRISSPNGYVRNFALGHYISQSGYDWTKSDLDDLVISVDYAATTINITINDWVVSEEFFIVI